jgi:hypothetical protein
MLRTRVGNQERNDDMELCLQALNEWMSIYSERIYMKRMNAEKCLNMERDGGCFQTMSGNAEFAGSVSNLVQRFVSLFLIILFRPVWGAIFCQPSILRTQN